MSGTAEVKINRCGDGPIIFPVAAADAREAATPVVGSCCLSLAGGWRGLPPRLGSPAGFVGGTGSRARQRHDHRAASEARWALKR
jgi:hypothetical protein